MEFRNRDASFPHAFVDLGQAFEVELDCDAVDTNWDVFFAHGWMWVIKRYYNVKRMGF